MFIISHEKKLKIRQNTLTVKKCRRQSLQHLNKTEGNNHSRGIWKKTAV